MANSCFLLRFIVIPKTNILTYLVYLYILAFIWQKEQIGLGTSVINPDQPNITWSIFGNIRQSKQFEDNVDQILFILDILLYNTSNYHQWK
ncbi:hypothetical protein D3C81_1173550 [compost metagenome]